MDGSYIAFLVFLGVLLCFNKCGTPEVDPAEVAAVAAM